MQILVDSSVWIDYLRGGGNSDELDYFIDENLVVINDLILAELVPFLRLKKPARNNQLAVQNHCGISSLDNHFRLMKGAIKLELSK